MTTTNFQPGKVYSLFNASGEVEEIEPLNELPIGTRVFAFGGGMSESIYCITSGKDANGSQNICLVSGYYPGSYFSPKQKFDKYSRPLSKKFGIGFYWDDIENVVFPQSKVEAAIRRANYLVNKIANQKQEQENADKKERDELPGKFPHLTPIEKGGSAKGNLIADLKNNFPGVKFSVKKEHYNTYNVSWEDGPTVTEVSTITNRFEDHCTDETGDYRDYSPSNFNRVFGGFKYVFENRKMSEKTAAALFPFAEQIKEENKSRFEYTEQICYRLFSRYSFVPGAVIRDVKRNDKLSAGDFLEFYDVIIETPDNTAPSASNFEIVDYSDKAIAVFGDTKPIKEELKKLGGRFNPHLTHNGVKCAGWVFSKKQAEELRKLLN